MVNRQNQAAQTTTITGPLSHKELTHQPLNWVHRSLTDRDLMEKSSVNPSITQLFEVTKHCRSEKDHGCLIQLRLKSKPTTNTTCTGHSNLRPSPLTLALSVLFGLSNFLKIFLYCTSWPQTPGPLIDSLWISPLILVALTCKTSWSVWSFHKPRLMNYPVNNPHWHANLNWPWRGTKPLVPSCSDDCWL